MFESTKELRQLIIDNPDLPLVIFATEDANNGDYYSMATNVLSVGIEEIALYENNDTYVDRDDYEELLTNDLANEDEYKDMTYDEYEQMIEDKVSKIEFTKCIYVLVGN